MLDLWMGWGFDGGWLTGVYVEVLFGVTHLKGEALHLNMLPNKGFY